MARKKTCFLALLRGINVGGNNIIAKDDLISCFQGLKYGHVKTYIQSGNVMFRSSNSSIKRLTTEIEKALTKRFDYPARAVVWSREQYADAVAKAHRSWGKSIDQKHNALFTFPELAPDDVLKQLPPPVKKLESVSTAKGVIFWSASKASITKTTIMKLAKTKMYKLMTVRNHNTVFKLKALLDELDQLDG